MQKVGEKQIIMNTKENNKQHDKQISETKVYWCESCNLPIYLDTCPMCGQATKYVATDARVVFPEEKLLLAIIEKKEPLAYENSFVINNINTYIIDGIKHTISIQKLKELPMDEILYIKQEFNKYLDQLDYDKFNNMIAKFTEANADRYYEISDEAINYVQQFGERYDTADMFVSLSGGKDSTVVSDIVTKSFPNSEIIHIFGDTTLEFPTTYEYKRRFARGHRVITAKNYEKNFEELCEQIGPPSRVMRWCCTVFKTGAITRKLTQVFKDKKNVLVYQGIRRSESASRSKYDRESKSPKIAKQTVAAPIIDWKDFDVWLYILTTKIDFNDAYRLGFSRVGCWCCPNNGAWSEFLSKIYLTDQYNNWRDLLINFAKKVGKPDPEEYIDSGNWKARQGGNGLEIAKTSIVDYKPCATEDNTFNYELTKPITEELYELFKPFGYINYNLGNQRLGEVYVLDRKGEVLLVLKGRIGTNKLVVTVKKDKMAGAVNLKGVKGKIECQLTKFQMCLGCKACEGVCRHNALTVKELVDGTLVYKIDDAKCLRCGECIGHFTAGCYMRKVLAIKRG